MEDSNPQNINPESNRQDNESYKSNDPQTVVTTPQPNITQSSDTQKKSKIILFIIIVVVVILSIALSAYFLFIKGDDADENSVNNDTNQLENNNLSNSQVSGALTQIDDALAVYKVEISPYEEKTGIYLIINEDGVYSRAPGLVAENTYSIGEVSTDGYCEDENVLKSSDTIKNIFIENDYQVVEGSIYTGGGGGCKYVVIGRNSTETCSASLTELQKESGGNYENVLAVGCNDLTDLTETISELQEIAQLREDVSGVPESGEMYVILNKLKDSVNPDYRIAVLDGPVSSYYYYKKGNDKWVEVDTENDNYELACNYTGNNAGDVRAAFEGESCGGYGSSETMTR